MLIREILPSDKDQFNQLATHPLQTYEWGEFRRKLGTPILRYGFFDGQRLVKTLQLTVHPIPFIGKNILYFPKGPALDKELLGALTDLGQKNHAIFIKLEPNILKSTVNYSPLTVNLRQGKPLFTRWTFTLDLTLPEEELLARMKPKTRYNIRLAQKHGVKVVGDNSEAGLETFINLHFETTRRQRFYSHSPDYYRQMKDILVSAGLEHLFIAYYQNQPISAMIFFVHQKTLYYPYGASTRTHKKVMAPYALFWEAIKWGKKLGCTQFDMWGTPGSNPSPADPWYGFHRFKEGFGPKLVEHIGTFDLVLQPRWYWVYNFLDTLRWKLLRFKSKLLHP
ncbi:MAG: peptidoglycan bridge formation glycyltransferase FemA/FemB family protein [Candidatus Shapirobacteria bacterium]